MRSMLRSIAFMSVALCATAAFAADRAVVNVPFNFETHGIWFPAGEYDASLDMDKSVLTLRNIADPKEAIVWVVSPADEMAIEKPLQMKFDDLGGTHELRTVQLGSRITSRLDAPARRHDAGSLVALVSGQ
ncbi:hypothetical protein HNQ77_001472 [Silvibacterium bohemicum]|uniref:Uncharacterized protein n=1 Tax=Silvibacterium bohemicum TaxID=1577686 RepID=A0A841JQ98_9BACT|nr:hypothetical protein [Silvibacterium bohemicum]MBB6143523.1 hypothetical protein [Silvibacterium bohemicum]